MKRGLTVALALAMALSAPAQAFCLLGCDAEISDSATATTAFQTQLGQPLPTSVVVEHIRQGGFQDKFLQIRLTTDQDGMTALLPMLGLVADPTGRVDPAQLGPDDLTWWTPQSQVALLGGPGRLAGYAETMVAVAPFPGTFDQVTIYIFAFQT
jgi:hypothetical protein